jgi:type VI secretion system secreted protein VgrG
MSANTTLYSFAVDGLEPGTFQVLSFSGTEALSAPTAFTVVAISTEKGFSRSEILGKEAVFTIHVNGDHPLRGLVASLTEEPVEGAAHRYVVEVRSRLFLAGQQAHCRVFRGKSAPQVLGSVLEEIGYDSSSWRAELAGNYPELELLVQYNESDLAFFQRLSERWGIWYSERVEDGAVVMVLGDDNSKLPESEQSEPMAHKPGAGMIEDSFDAMYELRRYNGPKRGKVRASSYHYDEPGTVQRGGNGAGREWSLHDTGFNTAAELTEHARRLLEADNLAHDRIHCSTHNPKLRAGRKFSISRDKGRGFDGEYIIHSVHHHGTQEGSVLGAGGNSHYSNEITAQPAQLPFRPPQATPRPRVTGVLVAKVDGPDDPYAHLDDAGRYRLRLPFDDAQRDPGEATPAVRLAQPYAGPGYGLHLPIHRGADMVLAFEDGDVDRPIALGALPNPAQKSPVAARNRTQAILRSEKGNQILLEDLADKTRIAATSATGQSLVLDDVPDTAGILLQTVHKHRLRLDDKGDTLELSVSDGTHSLTILSKKGIATLRTKSGHTLQLDDDKKAVSLQSAGGHLVKLDDDGGLVTIQDGKGKHVIQIDAGGKVTVKTEGDLELSAKGSLKMKAKDVSIQSESGPVDIKAAQALNLQGMEAHLKADQKIQVEAGMDAGIKAGLNLKLEGSVNVESKAGVANKMTGTLTNVESSALNTIKGAMVMIN